MLIPQLIKIIIMLPLETESSLWAVIMVIRIIMHTYNINMHIINLMDRETLTASGHIHT